jgi:hypothetical protein
MKTHTRKDGGDRLEHLAHRLDVLAVWLARGRPAIDVALGEIFLRMVFAGHVEELGFSRRVDFANEALGIPRRTYFSLSRDATLTPWAESETPGDDEVRVLKAAPAWSVVA